MQYLGYVLVVFHHVLWGACVGESGRMLYATLQLGIALLKEGNHHVQSVCGSMSSFVVVVVVVVVVIIVIYSPQIMLSELNSMDVGFLDSISKLISSCR